MSSVPLDTCRAEVFANDGVTLIGRMRYVRNVAWHEELSKVGWVSFDVPLTDPMTAHLEDRRIVKLTWMHRGYPHYQVACRLQGDAGQYAVDGRRWLSFRQQPDLMGMLGDAVLYPEYGLGRHSSGTRIFGFMSADGNWRLDGDWSLPQGYPMSEETGHRKGHPPELKKYDPHWIAYGNPAAHVPPSTVNYHRLPLVFTEGKYAQLSSAEDNFLTAYLDGEQIISPDPSNPGGWKNAQSVPLHLLAGDRLFAFKVENAPLANGGPLGNPIGLIYDLFELDNKGNVIGVIISSRDGVGIMHDNTPQPGWHRAQVLRQAVLEAQARGVQAVEALRLGFTDFHDSAGNAWPATERGEYPFDVGTSLVEMATQLSEAHFDWWVRPSDLKLCAWRRRGSDLSATVQLTVGSGDTGNLMDFSAHRRPARYTRQLVHSADNTWADVVDADAATHAGRIESSLTAGSTGDASTGAEVARQQLALYSTPRMFVDSAQVTTELAGALPGRNFKVGDTIQVPGWRLSGTSKQRVLSIDCDWSGDRPVFKLGFAEDTSV